jgi:hypothetical protein
MMNLRKIGTQLNSLARALADTRSDWVFTVIIAIIALLPRLYVALVWAKEPVWDGHYYHFGATRIAEGLGYSEDVIRQGLKVWKPWTHYPVGYSGFLAIFYAILGRTTGLRQSSTQLPALGLSSSFIELLGTLWVCGGGDLPHCSLQFIRGSSRIAPS